MFCAYPRNAKWLSPRNAGTTASNQDNQQPRREPENSQRQAYRRHHLLAHRADGIDHRHTVGSLDARALQFIVEVRVFIGGQVEPRGMFHHHQADVAREAVGQKRIEISDRARPRSRPAPPARTPRPPATRNAAARSFPVKWACTASRIFLETVSIARGIKAATRRQTSTPQITGGPERQTMPDQRWEDGAGRAPVPASYRGLILGTSLLLAPTP